MKAKIEINNYGRSLQTDKIITKLNKSKIALDNANLLLERQIEKNNLKKSKIDKEILDISKLIEKYPDLTICKNVFCSPSIEEEITGCKLIQGYNAVYLTFSKQLDNTKNRIFLHPYLIKAVKIKFDFLHSNYSIIISNYNRIISNNNPKKKHAINKIRRCVLNFLNEKNSIGMSKYVLDKRSYDHDYFEKISIYK